MTVDELIKKLKEAKKEAEEDGGSTEVIVTGAYCSYGDILKVKCIEEGIWISTDLMTG